MAKPTVLRTLIPVIIHILRSNRPKKPSCNLWIALENKLIVYLANVEYLTKTLLSYHARQRRSLTTPYPIY